MKCTLVKFPTYVTGSSLAEIVKTENTRISNFSDWLLICVTFVTKSPGFFKASFSRDQCGCVPFGSDHSGTGSSDFCWVYTSLTRLNLSATCGGKCLD